MGEIKRKDAATERRELSVEQLQLKLAEAREEEFRLRFRSATEAIDSPMRFRALRRDIARIQTVLREKKANG
jgi:large subunit ribosomal protein L29